MSFEGVYKWVAFILSKRNNGLPVPNRYFGAFENGTLKIRGIEARRHDTPAFFSRCQNDILEIMAKGNSINEVKSLMPKVKDALQRYVQLLKDKKVALEDLVFTKQTSKNSNEYQINRNTVENDVMHQLDAEGKYLKAGQILRYIITDYHHRHGKYSKKNRALPIELTNEKTSYDVKRYTELLAQVCNTVTEPFGYTNGITST
jgi:DNA polymerase-2